MLLGTYVYLASLPVRAWFWARSLDRTALERAAALEPANAEHQFRLGRFLLLANQDTDAALPHLRQAAARNPHVSRYWLQLAGAYQITGAREEQSRAIEQAVRIDPHTPQVAWEAGNLWLVRGNLDVALQQFRTVMESDAEMTRSALELSWRATHDFTRVIALLPPRAAAYAALLDLLVAQKEKSPAAKTWSELVALRQPLDPQLAFPYLDYLLAEQEVGQAQQVWRDLAILSTDVQSYHPFENMVVNGGFDEDMLNGGFDWRYRESPKMAMALDTAEFHGGRRSLSLALDANGASDLGLAQLVVVEPNTNYEFSAFVKSEEVMSANGPRVIVADVFSGNQCMASDEFIGTNPWRHVKKEFHTGPETKLVAVRLGRTPSEGHIRGKLWIDDVSILRK